MEGSMIVFALCILRTLLPFFDHHSMHLSYWVLDNYNRE